MPAPLLAVPNPARSVDRGPPLLQPGKPQGVSPQYGVLTNGYDTSNNVASYTTASIQPGPYHTLVAFVSSSVNSSANSLALTATGLDLAWGLRATIPWANNAAPTNQLNVFVAYTRNNPRSGTLQFNSAGANQTGCEWTVIELYGIYDIPHPVGTNFNDSGSASGTATLTVTPAATSLVFAAVNASNTTPTIKPTSANASLIAWADYLTPNTEQAVMDVRGASSVSFSQTSSKYGALIVEFALKSADDPDQLSPSFNIASLGGDKRRPGPPVITPHQEEPAPTFRSGVTVTHAVDAIVQKTFSVTHQVDAQILKTFSVTHNVDAIIKATLTRTHAVDAIVLKTASVTHTVDAIVQKTFSVTHSVDAIVKATLSRTHNVDAVVLKTLSVTHNVDAIVLKTFSVTHNVDAIVLKTLSVTHNVDAIIKKTLSVSHAVDAIVLKTLTVTHNVDAYVASRVTKTHTADARIGPMPQGIIDTDGFAAQVAATNAAGGSGFTGTYDTVGNAAGISFDTTVKRLSEHVASLKVVQDGVTSTSVRRTIAQQTLTESVYFRVANAPSVTSKFIVGRGPASIPAMQMNSSGQIRASIQATFGSFTSASYADGYWHRIDLTFDTSSATFAVSYSIDGVSQTGVTLGSQTPANMTSWELGSNNAGDTLTVWFQDFVISNLLADYPIGPHVVLPLYPNAEGTETLGSTNPIINASASQSNLYQDVDDWNGGVPDSSTYVTYTNTATGDAASNFAEWALTDPAVKYTDIWSVQGFIAGTASGTNANAADVRVLTAHGGTIIDRIGGAGFDFSSSALGYYRAVLAAPSGGWTNANLSAAVVQFGYATDTNPLPRLSAVMLEFAAFTLETEVAHKTDAIVKATLTKSHTVDAIVLKTLSVTHSVDAIVKKTLSVTHSVDAVIKKTLSVSHAVDAIIKATLSVSHAVDAIVLKTLSVAHATDAIILKTSTVTHSVDAIVLKTSTVTHQVDAYIDTGIVTRTVTHSTDAIILKTASASHTVDAIIKATATRYHTVDAVVLKTLTVSQSTDAIILKTASVSHSVDAEIEETFSVAHSVDAILRHSYADTHLVDAVIRKTLSVTHSIDAEVVAQGAVSHIVDAVVKATLSVSHSADAIVKKTLSVSHAVSAIVLKTASHSHTVDAQITLRSTVAHSVDAEIFGTPHAHHDVDADIFKVSSKLHQVDAYVSLFAPTTSTVAHLTDAWVYDPFAPGPGNYIEFHWLARPTEHRPVFLVDALIGPPENDDEEVLLLIL